MAEFTRRFARFDEETANHWIWPLKRLLLPVRPSQVLFWPPLNRLSTAPSCYANVFNGRSTLTEGLVRVTSESVGKETAGRVRTSSQHKT